MRIWKVSHKMKKRKLRKDISGAKWYLATSGLSLQMFHNKSLLMIVRVPGE